MIQFTDDQIDLFAQTAYAGFNRDGPLGGAIGWADLSPMRKGDWRRATRALLRHAGFGMPVNKAPQHMSEAETDLIGLCDEYEAVRTESGRLADATAELCSHRIAEHFELIRRAVHAARAGREAAA